MTRARMTKARIEELVGKLAGGAEVGGVLTEFGITLGEARKILQKGMGRRVVKELKGMQALQRELMLGELAPKAAEALARQMGAGAKADLQVRGALSVLGLGSPKKAAPEGAEEEKEAMKVTRLTEEEKRMILKESAEALAAADRERFAS